MSEVDPGFFLHLNWKSLRQMIHGFQMLATVTEGSMADVTISEFRPLQRVTKRVDLTLYVYLKSVYIDLHSKTP